MLLLAHSVKIPLDKLVLRALEGRNVVAEAHSRGICVRHLGLVRKHTTLPALRFKLLTELASRVIKCRMERSMRKTTQKSRLASSAPFVTCMAEAQPPSTGRVEEHFAALECCLHDRVAVGLLGLPPVIPIVRTELPRPDADDRHATAAVGPAVAQRDLLLLGMGA